ncbi:MAG TPA: YciI family protein [Candidatus Angelobacter sp.]|nr:YciI family protein [Candidatus Angelobacter sp.]
MRFMMTLPCPPDILEQAAAAPNKEIVTAMHRYNEEMTKAGVLLAAEGLHGTSKGWRIKVSGGKKIVTDGPFTEAKEVIAGFWIIQVKSKEEALEWAKRCPLPEHGLMEIRQVFENCDFPPELQKKQAQA